MSESLSAKLYYYIYRQTLFQVLPTPNTNKNMKMITLTIMFVHINKTLNLLAKAAFLSC